LGRPAPLFDCFPSAGDRGPPAREQFEHLEQVGGHIVENDVMAERTGELRNAASGDAGGKGTTGVAAKAAPIGSERICGRAYRGTV
jgi:hypothetical protein